MDITIRLREEADDPEIVSIRNEARPWLPPTSIDEYRWQADPANSPPNEINERWVAEADGTVVGLYAFGESSFIAREHTFGGSIGVAEAHRGRGFGDRLYHHLMDRAVALGATRIYAQVSEDNHVAAAFAEKRGFSKSGRATRLSRLIVEEANLDGYDGLVERLESEGITFKTMADVGMDDEPALRRLHEFLLISARDVPSSEEFGGIPFDVWLKWISAPNSMPEQSWIAYDGDRPVGVGSLSRRGETAAFNDYTGVDREYRGRGVARALKLKTIESARENGMDSIFTANDFENKPMLSINVPLGYQAVPAEVEIVKDL
jgi:GNAT superfamily N-acetyltransferase